MFVVRDPWTVVREGAAQSHGRRILFWKSFCGQ